MSNKVSPAIAVGADYTPPAPQQAQTAQLPPSQVSSDQADYRLIIEEDQATGAFIYKTQDRRTGEIIRQAPREEVLRLKEASEYAAGAIIKSRA